ncbi:hypothetical protein D3870_18095 [Noviherbaspirillum cavernae]|uniref:Uncharacterized protein n=1 Tax=Noviherbaspirillum cavernae TaxID=2320862 RepID=A0A418X594_9BURK|nr:hypothetical protein [Noviherbaspirillum cavernae]RJG07653.1 hypothetical protein D3870_18095 [Noviherbaspirillum cavernae]
MTRINETIDLLTRRNGDGWQQWRDDGGTMMCRMTSLLKWVAGEPRMRLRIVTYTANAALIQP